MPEISTIMPMNSMWVLPVGVGVALAIFKAPFLSRFAMLRFLCWIEKASASGGGRYKSVVKLSSLLRRQVVVIGPLYIDHDAARILAHGRFFAIAQFQHVFPNAFDDSFIIGIQQA